MRELSVFILSVLLLNGCHGACVSGPDVVITRDLSLNGAGSITDTAEANWINIRDAERLLRSGEAGGDYLLGAWTVPFPTQAISATIDTLKSSVAPITSLTVRCLSTWIVTSGLVTPFVYVNGTRYDGTPQTPTEYPALNYIDHEWTTNPDTGVAWTQDDINNAEIGVETSGVNAILAVDHVYAEVTYTLSDWNEAPSNLFTFTGDADTAISDYLQNVAIADANVSTLITYLEATVGTYRVTPFDVPKQGESLSNFPLVYIWTTGLNATFEETDTEQVNTRTRILVWAENNDPEASADTVQAICGAIASALQQTEKTTGSDWATFYSNWGEPDVGSQEVQFITADIGGEDAGFCRGELTVEWGHYAG